LQQLAEGALRKQLDRLDGAYKNRRGKPQAALVALDPRTGNVLAMVGGRDYAESQLNRATDARRQPGSTFKPFVYAAALDTAVQGGPHILTASTTVLDEPTTFYFDGKPYEPSNFKHEFHGIVTLREALAHSMNVATVKVAQMVGYDSVVDMANRAGMNYKIQPTPAVALGAYEITPIEAAGAYTIFSNHGEYVKPSFLTMVRTQEGKVIYKDRMQEKQVLDPRVSYLMTNLMEEVLRSGTAAAVRAQGFTVPAAGKTGTSHDGWFAGYTSELLCVVWVGFDEPQSLGLTGAQAALPAWVQFMQDAAPADPEDFPEPSGITMASCRNPAADSPAWSASRWSFAIVALVTTTARAWRVAGSSRATSRSKFVPTWIG